MAELVPDPVTVRAGTAVSIAGFLSGDAITPFDVLYQEPDGKAMKADNSDATKSQMVGVALTYAEDGGNVVVVPPGGIVDSSVDLWVPGLTYAIAPTAGRMMPNADLVVGQFLTIVGVAETARRFRVIGTSTGNAIA